MKRTSLLIIATFLFASFIQAQEDTLYHNSKIKNKMNIQDEKQSFKEIKEVTKALEPYIKSAKTGDGKLSRSAFFEHAHIVGSIGGTHYNMTADEFGGAVSEGGPSENIQHHIAWIDISGPAAAAKVEFIDWSGLRFTDFFVLYKKDGEWKISGKVYDSHSNN
ncbi:putative lumazine-binding protein [Lutibacter sp. Hel_I_33_5]|uniref:nuclear transport factor 2 family protein n=1 Tax=Lutibacter sp. Hel_I_33_5 TaxID=1566289 RepID=UPI0011A3869A|nr:nuclear transport factor 2 family protein [Lutibacter sp. Hel_I_33_5]TVZ55554.1 putative lumazine-binding protein [Lutibacter sp. Hel_I_33_5]